MKEIAITMVDDGTAQVGVTRADLVEAWSLLENLVCSLDRIGSRHAGEPGEAYDPERSRAFYEAVGRFVADNELLTRLVETRGKLGSYLSDDEAENLTERIAYWHERA
jgi:hypothetical protein